MDQSLPFILLLLSFVFGLATLLGCDASNKDTSPIGEPRTFYGKTVKQSKQASKTQQENADKVKDQSKTLFGD